MRIYAKTETMRKLIYLKGYSYTSFAKKVGISNGHLQLLFNHSRSASPESSNEIARTLEVDVEEIFFFGTQDEYDQLKEVK